jgi:hypothetical protein
VARVPLGTALPGAGGPGGGEGVGSGEGEFDAATPDFGIMSEGRRNKNTVRHGTSRSFRIQHEQTTVGVYTTNTYFR